ncbi:hypothetical protein THRCLA_07401 [Thraustotheca clavata]|uniref:PH domain-containing protein n=1 Tax=Thraustotheca clavata TaxID=74557 RepID=A0A1V9ZDG1_9STRA|nr:hypothetical protein THRCLA_07401 [Thraustotheca clavata]
MIAASTKLKMRAQCALHEQLYVLVGQDRVEWDVKLREQIKQLLQHDVLEREHSNATILALEDTLRACSIEINHLREQLDKKSSERENSNQVEEEEKPEVDGVDENVLHICTAFDKPKETKETKVDEKEAVIRAASPTAIQTTHKPTLTSNSAIAGRRRSSLRRKSITITPCKKSPGKVSVSPGKHGLANQLILIKTKKQQDSKTADNHKQRLDIKIARKFKPLKVSLFSFHPAAAAVPAPVLELGPQQNAIMLRQLRYVKGVMHELPWAKSRLRDMLSHYTQKDLSKEDLFPQLSHLSVQVQEDMDAKTKAQKQAIEAKSKQATTLQIAKAVINDLSITKYGRRGKPHDTKLFYDEAHPCILYWQSKQGDRSSSFLPLHAVKSIESGLVTPVFKRAARKQPDLDPSKCLSLVTEDRTLDLRLSNELQRDWLLKALQDAVHYAVHCRTIAPHKRSHTPRLRRM